MVPVAALPPTTPFTFHVTRWSEEFFTVALNWTRLFSRTLADVGEMLTLTAAGAVIVTDAVPLAVGVATLVALTDTLPEGTAPGAVYIPEGEIRP